MSYKHKSGPGRTYAAEELALFAEYRTARARCRPRRCDSGEHCWVEQGPPGISAGGKCRGCQGRPRSTTAPGYHRLEGAP